MKNFSSLVSLIIIIITIGISGCQNKKSNIPELAVAEFNKIYPKADKEKWTDHDSIWEVKFILDGVPVTSRFESDGIWIESIREVNSNMLPQAVVDKMNGFYSGYTIYRSILVENPDVKAYDIGIDVNTKKIDLLITETGEMRKAQVADPGK